MTMTRRSDNLLMIAARAPIAGETKTRLGKSIGMQEAADLYQAFLIDIAERLGQPNDAYDVGWTHSPPQADFAEILTALTGEAPKDVWFIPQDGPDWGIRQDNLLRWGDSHGYARSILIASDSPHLQRQTILDAFAALEAADVALGRVRDGGYYLIGLRGYAGVLHNVAMSTSSAADGVVERATALGLSVAEITPTFDIDEVEDIDLLTSELTPDGNKAPATWAALRRLGRHVHHPMQGPETEK